MISEIQSIAADEIATIRKDLVNAAPIADVKMRSPETAGDLAWAFDLQLADDEHEQGTLESAVHGSGVQSVLAFHVLHLVDTRSMGRGWVKGAVWAIEEPESFLHFAMQTVLRDHLRVYTEGSMQVMLTTHSAVFACASDRGQHVVRRSFADGGTAFADRDSRELVRSCTSSVLGFTHPLVVGELKPMLVVEGDTDREMIVRALAYMGRVSPWEIVTLNDLDSTFTGGWASLKTWFRGNRSALKARDERSPVFVLLDEDVKSSDAKQIGEDLAIHPSSKVIRVVETMRNPELSLPGAEGWWSTDHVLTIMKSIGVKHSVKEVADDVGNVTERKIQIKKSDQGQVKSALQDSISSCSRQALTFVESKIVPFIDASSSAEPQTILPLVGDGVKVAD